MSDNGTDTDYTITNEHTYIVRDVMTGTFFGPFASWDDAVEFSEDAFLRTQVEVLVTVVTP